uniref:cysteine hydrolase family protein n=1 Tax=Klebsiella pneumoniae TaxID=573 RepID=UPI003D7C342F
MLFPNFSLGEEYEHAPPATNRQISPYLPSGRFRTGLPVEGLAIERGDLFYACPRASVFYGTALDADLRTRGVSTLVMAGISTTGVVLSSVAGLVMRTTTCVWSRDCCYDPDRDAHEALLRSGFGGRVQVV